MEDVWQRADYVTIGTVKSLSLFHRSSAVGLNIEFLSSMGNFNH